LKDQKNNEQNPIENNPFLSCCDFQ